MIVVIGGGPAGRYAAMRLARAGKKVQLIEKRSAGVGGQCLHQGCMIICALNDVARFIQQARVFQQYGFLGSGEGFSYPVLIQVREIIRIIAGVLGEGIQARLRSSGVCRDREALRIDGVETPYEAVIVASEPPTHTRDIGLLPSGCVYRPYYSLCRPFQSGWSSSAVVSLQWFAYIRFFGSR